MENFWNKIDIRLEDECHPWKGSLDKDGYGVFSVGKRKLKAHRVAWELSNGKIPVGMCVCHKCDQRSCCNKKHLFIGTHADNMADCKDKGRTCQGARHGGSKLTEDQVREIASCYFSGETQSSVSKRFGVSQRVVSAIVLGKSWGYTGIHSENREDGRFRKSRGISHWKSKLTELQVIAIMTRYLQGTTRSDIAREFRLDWTTVNGIVKGKSWTHLFS